MLPNNLSKPSGQSAAIVCSNFCETHFEMDMDSASAARRTFMYVFSVKQMDTCGMAKPPSP
jgi:hypothetical protein